MNNYENLKNLILEKKYDLFFKELINNKSYYSKDNQKENLFYYIHTSQDENVVNKFLNIMTIKDIDNLRIKNLKRYLNENNKVLNSKVLYEEIPDKLMIESLTYQELKTLINFNENELYNLSEKFPLLLYKNYKLILNDLFISKDEFIYKLFDINTNRKESIKFILNSLDVNINKLYNFRFDNGNLVYYKNEEHDKQIDFLISIIEKNNQEENFVLVANEYLHNLNKNKKNQLTIETIKNLIPYIEYKYYQNLTNNTPINKKIGKTKAIKI